MTCKFDIAVIGSGFAGSLIAMIAHRLGYSVILIERGKHPRFAIGESSTPLANLLLDELTKRYDLTALQPLTKWGSWQRSYPHIGCGLKRGFTFYHHPLGAADSPYITRARQLMVAASPHDEIADTHWYRADFDALLVDQARALGVTYLDEAAITDFIEEPDGISCNVCCKEEACAYHFRFVIDATGPRGFLHSTLRLAEAPLPGYPATQTIYSHFRNVQRPPYTWPGEGSEPPYPPEDAAVHHVFDGGWIWVLRFNNGITSAGVAATEEVADQLRFSEGEPAWQRLLTKLPNVRSLFADAKAIEPFRYAPRLSFLTAQPAGRRWAMLPSAAGFVDPLLSTGFPLTLLGVKRIAEMLERSFECGFDHPELSRDLHIYATQTTDELLATARLVGALYANMSNFPVFRSLCLLYFAAASYSETARRLHKPHLASSFLLHDQTHLGTASKAILHRAMHLALGAASEQLVQEIIKAIDPIDVAGLCDIARNNWYPVEANDILRSAAKVDTTPSEIEALLQSSGFYAVQPT